MLNKRIVALLILLPWCTPAQAQQVATSAALRRELQAAKRTGIPITPSELQAPLPPPERNAASLYTQLTELLDRHPISQEEESRMAAAMRAGATEAEIQAADALLRAHSDALELAHRAAERPQCVFRRD